MPIHQLQQVRPQATNSPNHLMQTQTLVPRPVMSTPHGFIKRQLMTEASVRKFAQNKIVFNFKIDIENI